VARNFSLSSDFSSKHDIYRFGFHGLSVGSVTRRVHSLIGQDPERMVVCHMGASTSVTAVKRGLSVETTMGYAQATGLPMGNRAGDLDTMALLKIMQEKHWLPADAGVFLNTSGGLVGMCGDSDIRMLLERRVRKDEEATRALEKYSYEVKKAIASCTIALNGLDVLVLTATAAIRSAELRELILSDLEHLGIKNSKDRNNSLVGREGVISHRSSSVKVVVVKNDEAGEMMRVVKEINHQKSK
jgi:acetate kinase